MTVQETLNSLLRVHQSRDLIKYDVPNNHTPMVLIALYRMGGIEGQLNQYFNNLNFAAIDTSSIKSTSEIKTYNWKKHLGEFEATSDYCQYFLDEIQEKGYEKVLKESVPTLFPGVAAHALHPLLRIGYGIDMKNETEIGMGLGYWAGTWLPLPKSPDNKQAVTLQELFNSSMENSTLNNLEMDSPSITGRIQKVYQCREFADLIPPVNFSNEDPLEELSQFVMDAFIETHHFTILHALTSCHALRLLIPYCDEPGIIFNQYCHALCALNLTVQNLDQDFKNPLPTKEMDWEDLFEAAIKTNIEHTIKCVYSCYQEALRYHREDYILIAQREVLKAAPFV